MSKLLSDPIYHAVLQYSVIDVLNLPDGSPIFKIVCKHHMNKGTELGLILFDRLDNLKRLHYITAQSRSVVSTDLTDEINNMSSRMLEYVLDNMKQSFGSAKRNTAFGNDSAYCVECITKCTSSSRFDSVLLLIRKMNYDPAKLSTHHYMELVEVIMRYSSSVAIMRRLISILGLRPYLRRHIAYDDGDITDDYMLRSAVSGNYLTVLKYLFEEHDPTPIYLFVDDKALYTAEIRHLQSVESSDSDVPSKRVVKYLSIM